MLKCSQRPGPSSHTLNRIEFARPATRLHLHDARSTFCPPTHCDCAARLGGRRAGWRALCRAIAPRWRKSSLRVHLHFRPHPRPLYTAQPRHSPRAHHAPHSTSRDRRVDSIPANTSEVAARIPISETTHRPRRVSAQRYVRTEERRVQRMCRLSGACCRRPHCQ